MFALPDFFGFGATAVIYKSDSWWKVFIKYLGNSALKINKIKIFILINQKTVYFRPAVITL